MVTETQFQEVVTRIDNATNAIAEQLRQIKEELANAGLSAEVEASVFAQLESAATKLEAVGKTEPEA